MIIRRAIVEDSASIRRRWRKKGRAWRPRFHLTRDLYRARTATAVATSLKR